MISDVKQTGFLSHTTHLNMSDKQIIWGLFVSNEINSCVIVEKLVTS